MTGLTKEGEVLR
jgi:hypothetical protein